MKNGRKSKNIVIIFAKKPELGKVKTRIAKETSDDFALDFSLHCFNDLLIKIRNSDYYDLAVAVDNLQSLAWFQKNFSIDGITIAPGLNGVSDKFDYLFGYLLNEKQYSKAILIPMDIPFLTCEEIISSFARLSSGKYLLGPEVNGGVYLIGAAGKFKPGIFDKVRWSTIHSFEDLMSNAGNNTPFVLPLKNDLNLPNDIVALREEISYHCPTLHDFLIKNNFFEPLNNKFINYDGLKIPVPALMAIIKKQVNNNIYYLLHERFRPVFEPESTGKLEIFWTLPDKTSCSYEKLRNEIKTELGVDCLPSEQVVFDDNESFASRPLFVLEDRGNKRRYSFLVYELDAFGDDQEGAFRKTRNPRWVKQEELIRLIDTDPEAFHSPSLSSLKAFFNKKQKAL